MDYILPHCFLRKWPLRTISELARKHGATKGDTTLTAFIIFPSKNSSRTLLARPFRQHFLLLSATNKRNNISLCCKSTYPLVVPNTISIVLRERFKSRLRFADSKEDESTRKLNLTQHRQRQFILFIINKRIKGNISERRILITEEHWLGCPFRNNRPYKQ